MNEDIEKATIENDTTAVPRIIHESSMARLEMAHKSHNEHLMDVIKRLWWVVILLIVLLVVTNGAWIYYESQFIEEVTETVTTSTDGGGNAYGSIVSGNNSEVNYGKNDSNQNKDSHP